MIRHGRYHDERQAEDHDGEVGSVIALVIGVVLMLSLVTLTLWLSPNARW